MSPPEYIFFSILDPTIQIIEYPFIGDETRLIG